jgi:phenylacetate-CoA ligase
MSLLPGLRQQLEQRFAAPVLDLYSMNEAGPIAVFDPGLQGHVLLQAQLYVEILDPAGRSLPLGERGEITVTGGFNFCLPLLRYRTGDYASLHACATEWVLHGLAGRPPVRYRRADGSEFNNVELTHALRPLGLAQWQVHQFANGAVRVRLGPRDEALCNEVQAVLAAVFGPSLALRVEIHAQLGDGQKVIQYTADE